MAAEEVYPQLEEGMLPQLGLPPSLHIVNTDAKASDGSARGGNIVQLFRRCADTTGSTSTLVASFRVLPSELIEAFLSPGGNLLSSAPGAAEIASAEWPNCCARNCYRRRSHFGCPVAPDRHRQLLSTNQCYTILIKLA